MSVSKWKICAATVSFVFPAFFFMNARLPLGWAADRFENGPFLNIGIPDAPRRVQQELPEASKSERIILGPLRLHPFYTERVDYESNVLLRHEDPKEDVSFTETPGVTGKLRLGPHKIEGGYGAEIVNFVKNGEENAVNHMANLRGEFNFNDFQLTAEDAFEKSTGRLYDETSDRDRLLLNVVEVKGRYDRPKWASEITWTHNTVRHETPTLNINNYNEDILALLGGYKVLPKTLLLTELDLGTVYYGTNQQNADQSYWQLLGGVRGEPMSNLEMTAKMGFQGRMLGDVLEEGPQTDFNGLVVSSDVVYRPTDADTIHAGYLRSVKTSTFQLSSWYRQDQIFANYRRRIMKKWYVTPQVSWQFNDYPEGATIGGETRRRNDSFWVAGIGLQYKIQEWAWTGIKYNFQARDSNFDAFDYSNNRITFDVSLRY